MAEDDGKKSTKSNATREFTEKELGQISGLRAGGVTVEEIATFMRCNVSTLRKRAKKALAEGAAHVDSIVTLNVIQKAMRGEKPYDIFYLKTRRGWRETHNVQPLDADGKPTTGLGGLSSDQLGSLIAALTTEESAGSRSGRKAPARREGDGDHGPEAGALEPTPGSTDSGD